MNGSTRMRQVGLLPGMILALGLAIFSASCGDDDAPVRLGLSLPLYDDFSSGTIAGSRWDQQTATVDGMFILQSDLSVTSDGKLQASLGLNSHSGGFPPSRVRFNVSPQPIAYYAEVTVTSASGSGSSPRARLDGFFYNDGTLPNPGGGADFSADIQGQIRIKTNGDVEGVFTRCDGPPCSTADLLGSVVNLGSVGVGNAAETVGLYIASDTATVFTLQLNNQAPVTVDLAALGAPFSTLPRNSGPWHRVGVQANTFSVTTTGSITATFDNVRAGF